MSESDSETQRPRLLPEQYTVGWICALACELQAGRAMFDEVHAKLDIQSRNDGNNYILGRIGKHSVAMAVLPQYGTNRAATAVKAMQFTFSSLRFVLVVGIGGGVHSDAHDIRLGDLVISMPDGQGGGVVQYDLGREGVRDFHRVGTLNEPPSFLTTAVVNMRSEFSLGKNISKLIVKTISKIGESGEQWEYPGTAQDTLFHHSYIHIEGNRDCADCGAKAKEGDKIAFVERKDIHPVVHYGNVGSGNTVIKNAVMRDLIATKENLLCFEMEAAGLMNDFPSLIIRGISDYADSHKNSRWQPYAAIVSAAYAKRLLRNITPQTIKSNATTKEVRVLEEALLGLNTKFDDIKVLHHKRSEKVRGDERQEILAWLTTANYTTQQKLNMDIRQEGTGKWFLESEPYNDWKYNRGRMLLYHGTPGAGKTILSAIAVDDLTKWADNQQNIGVGYIYCSYREHSHQKANDLIASLLKQLCQRMPALPKLVEDLYRKNADIEARLSFSELSAALRDVVTLYTEVFIVIDALDECQVADNCRRKFLTELFLLNSNCGVNIFATSRTLPQIIDQFDNSQRVVLQAHDEDVVQYLQESMGDLPSFVQDDLNLQVEIRESIVGAIGGMFLLARLYLCSLMVQMTKSDMRTALRGMKRLPRGYTEQALSQLLEEEYNKTLQRINSQRPELRNLAMKVFLWLTFTKSELDAEAIRQALATRKINAVITEDGLHDPKDIITVCSGLVLIDKDNKYFRTIHYTTQEYLRKNIHNWLLNPEAEITGTCLTYLLFYATSSQSKPHKAFHDYARKHWGYHARDAPAMKGEIMAFLKNQAKLVYGTTTTGLHLAAYFGITFAIRELISHPHIDQPNKSGRTPLSYASDNGHTEMVELLLSTREVDVNSQDKDGKTSLHFAALQDDTSTVLSLLQANGVQPNLKDNYGRTPLLAAAIAGYESVVEVLIAHPAVDLNSTDGTGRTLLTQVASRGQVGVAKLLVKRDDIDINLASFSGFTPFTAASLRNDDKMMELLVQTGKLDPYPKYRPYPKYSPGQPISSSQAMIQSCVRHLDFPPLPGNESLLGLLGSRRNEPILWPELKINEENFLLKLEVAVYKGRYELARLIVENYDIDENWKKQRGKELLSWVESQIDHADAGQIYRLIANLLLSCISE